MVIAGAHTLAATAEALQMNLFEVVLGTPLTAKPLMQPTETASPVRPDREVVLALVSVVIAGQLTAVA